MQKPESKKTIAIIKENFDKFLTNPKESFRRLLNSSVGRINIAVGDRVFYLMTQEKFDFFIKYELKKQKLSFQNALDNCLKGHTQEEEEKPVNDSHMTQAQKSLLKIKSRFALFDNLSDADVIAIMNNILISKYKNGEKIFTIGTTGKDVFFIVQGTVSVFVGVGGDIEVATLKKTQFFGEMAYIMNEPRTATIKASSDIVLLLSFSINPKIEQGTEIAYMKFYNNINKMLAQKLVAENKKKG